MGGCRVLIHPREKLPRQRLTVRVAQQRCSPLLRYLFYTLVRRRMDFWRALFSINARVDSQGIAVACKLSCACVKKNACMQTNVWKKGAHMQKSCVITMLHTLNIYWIFSTTDWNYQTLVAVNLQAAFHRLHSSKWSRTNVCLVFLRLTFDWTVSIQSQSRVSCPIWGAERRSCPCETAQRDTEGTSADVLFRS